MKKISLLIVDDHRIFIDGLCALLKDVDDMEVIATAENGNDAILKALEKKPDVILMDMQMPGKTGYEATRELLIKNQQARVVALTMSNESTYIKKMLDAGARGYILKTIDKDDLIHVIRKVHAGEKYLDPAVTSELINNFTARPTASPVESLTRREKEILALIAQGLTDKEIAGQVHLSPLTVITHRKNLLSKLGLKNKVELTRFAVDNKLIS